MVTAVAEEQRRNRLCPPRRFANLRAVRRNCGPHYGGTSCAAGKTLLTSLIDEGTFKVDSDGFAQFLKDAKSTEVARDFGDAF